MTDTRVTELLESLAETAPEPSQDLVGAVLRSTDRRRGAQRRTRGRFAPALVALATVVAVLAAVGVVAVTGRSKGPATQPAAPAATTSQDALAAAKQFAGVFFSPDYRTVDDYNRRVVEGSTGTFRSDFASKQGDLAQLLTKARSIARGEVLAAAPREVTATTAQVLIVTDQTVQNALTNSKPQPLRTRVTARLRLVNGRWLIETFDPAIGGSAGCADATATREDDELLRQSCAAVGRLFSFSYQTLDADFAAQRAATTGPFTNEIGRVTNPAVRPLALREHVTVRAVAFTAAVERQSGDTATVLLFLDQDVTLDLLKQQPRLDRNRVEATMRRVDGHWLVAGLRAL